MYVMIVQSGYQGAAAGINCHLPRVSGKASTNFINAAIPTTHVQAHDPVEFDLANQQQECTPNIRLPVGHDEK
jgi:hypothetical protein